MFGAARLTDELVAAAADGAELARAQVLEALRPQVWLMVMGRLSPSPAHWGAIDDLGAQVVLALLEGFDRLEQPTVRGLKAYLSGIVRHKVADFVATDGKPGGHHLAIHSLESTVAGPSGTGRLHEFLVASGITPLSAVALAERISRLRSELGRLKDTYRLVITLMYFDQLRLAEIALQMQRSPKAVSVLLRRALRILGRNMTRPTLPADDHDQAA
jgi:RNA polymerase sigma factor (sigma-70 family)